MVTILKSVYNEETKCMEIQEEYDYFGSVLKQIYGDNK